MKKMELLKKIEEKKARSAWERGVKDYAIELIDYSDIEEFKYIDYKTLEYALLNGAEDWQRYSYGGCSLIFDGDIATRLCTPSELKIKKNGDLQPNKNETWLDIQARALRQASYIIQSILKSGD